MRSRVVTAVAALLIAVALVSCQDGGEGGGGGPLGLGGVETEPPPDGACRLLTPESVAAASDDSETVDCSEEHNAETFYVGELAGAADLAYDDPSVGAQVFEQCRPRYLRFVGASQSLALRTVVDWAWWRPSEEAWDEGARWFRCDVVGGNDRSSQLVSLPRTAEGLLLGIPPPRWMLCADGPVVADAPTVPCSEKHTWRAVSAVVVGEPEDKWPGERVVEVNTRDFCRGWVSAWLSYPLDYEFGYTWFGEAEWRAGNRQSVCWAKTDS